MFCLLDVYTMLDQKHFERFDDLIDFDPQLLNSLRNWHNSSLLIEVARDGKQNLFNKLLKYQQDLSVVDSDGWNVFHYVAAYRNDKSWFDGLKKYVNDGSKLKELLDQNNNLGLTSLHCAARFDNHKNIKWLLSNGADVNATTNGGNRADDLFGDAKTKRSIREHRDK